MSGTTGSNRKTDSRGNTVAGREAETRKAYGVYYTPTPLVDYVVQHTVGALLKGKTLRQAAKRRILDPACGSGLFLQGAYRYLLRWYCSSYVDAGPEKHGRELCQSPGGWRLTAAAKKHILLRHIYGVDIDPQAVEAAQHSLLQMMLEDELSSPDGHAHALPSEVLPSLGSNLFCGNAVIGPDFYDHSRTLFLDGEVNQRIQAFDWRKAFPEVMAAGGFDAVIGNPPWGQKGIGADKAVKHYLRARYPSAAGIHDLFRPFVERSVELTTDSGMFGMVLPDIVLLKNYPETRRYLLDHLTLTAIDWWGRAFPDAVIDAVTLVGIKHPAPPDHRVCVTIHDRTPFTHEIPQADFRANPRYGFNLFLTSEKRCLLDRLAKHPKLGDYFEIHEGIHSGNIRADLFVPSAVDDSCRELVFGRDEIMPYRLQWQGQYVRLNAVPAKKTRALYANLGRPEWHERDKVLVRRTGDFILAAVDRQHRYASNNFFLVFPKSSCSLDLDGLCALLNSRFLTWYFRIVEPRPGRVFAELKIKHLRTFPLPVQVLEPQGCRKLNELGALRSACAAKMEQLGTLFREACAGLDGQIDALVRELLRIPEAEQP